MDMPALLSAYGVWAVLVGTFVEGEGVVLAGAWAAERGYMTLYELILAALLGSFAGDQCYFMLGRAFGQPWLRRQPRLARVATRVLTLLNNYEALFVIAFRFLYGLRTVAPIVLGASGMSPRLFLPLNFLGAFLWATSISLGGALLIEVLQRALSASAPGLLLSVALSVLVPLALAALTFGPRWAARSSS